MNKIDYEKRIQTIALIVIALILSGIAIQWLKPLIAPLSLALLFVLAIDPLIDLLKDKAKIPQTLAVAITLIMAVLLISMIGTIIALSFNDLVDNSAVYQVQLLNIVEIVKGYMPDFIKNADITTKYEDILKLSLSGAKTVSSRFAKEVVELTSNGMLIALFTIFLLLGKNKGKNQMSEETIWGETKRKIQSYLLIKTGLSIATGILVGVTLFMLDVKFPLMFGVLTAMLNFIPSFGPIIAVLLPMPFFLISPEMTPLKAVLAVAIPTAIHFIGGNIVEPAVFGKNLRLSPIVLILALILFGMIWGFIGMFLSIPLTILLKILFEKSEQTKFLARAMEGDFSKKSDF